LAFFGTDLERQFISFSREDHSYQILREIAHLVFFFSSGVFIPPLTHTPGINALQSDRPWPPANGFSFATWVRLEEVCQNYRRQSFIIVVVKPRFFSLFLVYNCDSSTLTSINTRFFL
jgi:hypothetical protein